MPDGLDKLRVKSAGDRPWEGSLYPEHPVVDKSSCKTVLPVYTSLLPWTDERSEAGLGSPWPFETLTPTLTQLHASKVGVNDTVSSCPCVMNHGIRIT